MSLEIEVFDPYDDAALAAWLDVTNVADEHERGAAATSWTLPEIEVVARNPRKNVKDVRVIGSVDGVVVASGQVRMPQLDNLSAADIEVSVLPEHRRQGHGSAMLAASGENALTDAEVMDLALTVLGGSTDNTNTQMCLNLLALHENPD